MEGRVWSEKRERERERERERGVGKYSVERGWLWVWSEYSDVIQYVVLKEREINVKEEKRKKNVTSNDDATLK